MSVSALHLVPGEALPPRSGRPFKAVLVATSPVPEGWRKIVSDWLIESGCLYFMATGVECETWHDCLDWANLNACDGHEIPQESFVMTTWHADEPLSEVLWFAYAAAEHPVVSLEETLLISVGEQPPSLDVLALYHSVAAR
ncbi:MAG: hypothetical protein RL145_2138 [Pseudomonadota bacterium]